MKSTKTTGRGPGRPRGQDFPIHRSMMLTTEDYEGLQRLAKAWGVSVAEAVRRTLRAELDRHERQTRPGRIQEMQRRLGGPGGLVEEYLQHKQAEIEAERRRDEARDAVGP